MPNKKGSLYPKDWMAKAQKDLKRVGVLLSVKDTAGAGFHLQQAIEKYLKSYLLSKGWKLEYIHDLPKLLNYANEYNPKFVGFRILCERVTEYYTSERYPFFDEIAPSGKEIKKALEDTKKLIRLIKCNYVNFTNQKRQGD
ncbi:MAG: HEPN domain-containing protein [Planctomycetota bacterium]|nr:HEPN domain-containing protein [Planctomycetota bacterium]MDI6788194.1 HEPN domain-containing protein [Planctomycetota bacterium]